MCNCCFSVSIPQDLSSNWKQQHYTFHNVSWNVAKNLCHLPAKWGEGKDKPQNPSPSSVIVCGVAHINFELLQQILPRHHHLRLLTRRKKNSLVKSFNGREHSLEVLGKFTHTHWFTNSSSTGKEPTFVQIRVGRFPGCAGCAKWMFYFLSVYFFYKFLFGTRFALVQMIRLFN